MYVGLTGKEGQGWEGRWRRRGDYELGLFGCWRVNVLHPQAFNIDLVLDAWLPKGIWIFCEAIANALAEAFLIVSFELHAQTEDKYL